MFLLPCCTLSSHHCSLSKFVGSAINLFSESISVLPFCLRRLYTPSDVLFLREFLSFYTSTFSSIVRYVGISWRPLIDEFYCLLCLKACSKSSGAVEKISYHKTGLSTIASCITSSHMKSRIVAIELLTVVCRAPEFGNSRVLEAMTTIRILFGESVRFKFLVSVLNSNITSSSGLEQPYCVTTPAPDYTSSALLH
ncbi:hypothetical protein AVEN_8353-1 [Araneus ventricosus]|uniref:Uncharacterized protein n=1 Tax=Araneus ventricosus TaxID=182803 RepID=A0A4Y2QH31_ARAVE|nr:hypothetical protein AVEN_8353-1 [Araneus ventricosus]